jgi:hypothetical protein
LDVGEGSKMRIEKNCKMGSIIALTAKHCKDDKIKTHEMAGAAVCTKGTRNAQEFW